MLALSCRLVILVHSGVCVLVSRCSMALWLLAVSRGCAWLCVRCDSRCGMFIRRRMMKLCLCTCVWPYVLSIVLLLAVTIRLLLVSRLVSVLCLCVWKLALFLYLKTAAMPVFACPLTLWLVLMNVSLKCFVTWWLTDDPLVFTGLISMRPGVAPTLERQ